MKKLPKVYKNNIKNIHNNKKIFDSLNEVSNIDNIVNEVDKINVKDKIKKLIKDKNYIFNTKVTLVFKDREEVCNIAGVVNNNIITMDNQIIKIKDLSDIKY